MWVRPEAPWTEVVKVKLDIADQAKRNVYYYESSTSAQFT